MTTPSVQNQVPLAQDLQAILPIGIPLGWQLQNREQSRLFGVRRGGRFVYLDDQWHHLWDAAWRGIPRQALIDSVASESKCKEEDVAEGLDGLLGNRMLVQLGGDWREDWERIATLRLLPRGFVLDSNSNSGFRLVSPDGRWEMWLGVAEYAVWSWWDGTNPLAEAVAQAMEGTGLPQSLLSERAHSLLIAAARLRAIFLDELVPEGSLR